MGKEKFTYNTQTLRYERVEQPIRAKITRVFGFICAALFTAFVFTLVLHEYFPSPKEKTLQREISFMKTEYKALSGAFELLGEQLDNLQQRDAYAHRMIFGMDPIDEGIWEGGVGGHEQFQEFLQFKNSGEMLISIKQKVEKLKRQMVVQSQIFGYHFRSC